MRLMHRDRPNHLGWVRVPNATHGILRGLGNTEWIAGFETKSAECKVMSVRGTLQAKESQIQ